MAMRLSSPHHHPTSSLLLHSRVPYRICISSTPSYPAPCINKRTFLSNPFSAAPCPLRQLTLTRTVPYPGPILFDTIADVASYPSFLPFAISSTIKARDSNGYPSKATLRVGYDKFGLEEDWDSMVSVDPKSGTVLAQSDTELSASAKQGSSGADGLFELLKTRWVVTETGKEQSDVKLDVEVQFRNFLYDQMFAQAEGKVAGMMIGAFEKRVRALMMKERCE